MLETIVPWQGGTKQTIITEVNCFSTHPGGCGVPDLARTILPVFMQLASKQGLA